MLVAYDALFKAADRLRPSIFGRQPSMTKVAQATGLIHGAIKELDDGFAPLRTALNRAVAALDNAPTDAAAISNARREAIEGVAELSVDPRVADALHWRFRDEWML